ncbi:hypothetical protein EYF80_054775 [Liparis tanakae]|uniref:Uncharacterized protein n=1 Tax=Liparis tanakae TaxID=230148 RepID=A0A4Z2F2S4_9TELE|nr:hypothetical protein EYF80_054775 [Liparis tanakae]
MCVGSERGMSGNRALEGAGQLWDRYSLGLKLEALGAPRDTIRCLYLDSGFCSSRSSMSSERSASCTASSWGWSRVTSPCRSWKRRLTRPCEPWLRSALSCTCTSATRTMTFSWLKEAGAAGRGCRGIGDDSAEKPRCGTLKRKRKKKRKEEEPRCERAAAMTRLMGPRRSPFPRLSDSKKSWRVNCGSSWPAAPRRAGDAGSPSRRALFRTRWLMLSEYSRMSLTSTCSRSPSSSSSSSRPATKFWMLMLPRWPTSSSGWPGLRGTDTTGDSMLTSSVSFTRKVSRAEPGSSAGAASSSCSSSSSSSSKAQGQLWLWVLLLAGVSNSDTMPLYSAVLLASAVVTVVAALRSMERKLSSASPADRLSSLRNLADDAICSRRAHSPRDFSSRWKASASEEEAEPAASARKVIPPSVEQLSALPMLTTNWLLRPPSCVRSTSCMEPSEPVTSSRLPSDTLTLVPVMHAVAIFRPFFSAPGGVPVDTVRSSRRLSRWISTVSSLFWSDGARYASSSSAACGGGGGVQALSSLGKDSWRNLSSSTSVSGFRMMSRLFTCTLVTCRELSRSMEGQSELTNWYSSLMSASWSRRKALKGEELLSRGSRGSGAGASKPRFLCDATSRSKSAPVSTSSSPCTVSDTSASYGRFTKRALVPNTLSTEM